MNPCPSCHRQPGDGDECRHCGQVVVGPSHGKPLEDGAALEAVAEAREVLKNARKERR